MYLVFFALLSAVAGWAAWRGNPLYSTRATSRFVVVGLTVAAVVAGIFAELAVRVSAAAAFGTMFAAVTIGTCVLIWVVAIEPGPTPPATIVRTC